MVIAVVGRRISRPGADPQRFPDSCADAVRDELAAVLRESGATDLVASGACGTDLLALEAAGAVGLNRTMVLARSRDWFRARSVADADYPRDWGAVFDRVADEVAARGGLIVVDPDGDSDEAAFRAVNRTILDTAEALARGHDRPRGSAPMVMAVVVWDGHGRGPGDLTESFLHEAQARGFAVRQVRTTADAPANG